uniref:5'-3' exoribonuclease 2 isoform X1 n=1 Tax=Ciona intestinalis TaxID=7719 RepID=UPI0002B8D7D9|nr:5'-3' exoribonuclease 2 isoform X1 [Ciona intestinalis]|eukprot:XP_002129696.2 5'-3' exoribonuclease 2 isoform X1 [Ciona intestinalis]
MGVPAFFRWLSRKYSSIVIHCNEEKAKEIDGVTIPVDTSLPNPNDIEFDNLYLDMNGIIHPCSHPEDRPAPKNEQEIMIAIFDSIDRLFSIVRPRRVLYMAIDGVAPRAKMNQQRSRRFRASKEGVEQTELKASIRAELLRNGMRLPEVDPKAERFDSNCITPGTEFMFRLAACLRFYIIDRLNNDPGWRNIEVILSDANVPGEGEHKIMDFIRKQRGQPDHDPNTHHCICGADADLIMLGLATHEPNFTIIREEFKPNQPRPCGICAQYGHEMADCCGLPRDQSDELNVVQSQPHAGTNYIFIRICVIREYIKLEMEMPGLPFKYDFENIIDDWVMMCFFVGNDFLPHLPSLEIREGAIDKLVRLYKDIVHQTGGYLTCNGKVNLSRVEKIMMGIGKLEDEIFRKRRESDVNYRAREKAKRQRTKRDQGPSYIPGSQFAPTPLGSGFESPNPLTNVKQSILEMRSKDLKNLDAAASLRAMLSKSSTSTQAESSAAKRKKEDNDDDEPDDDVRLWEDGWKERYFRAKFNVSMKDFEFRRTLVRCYVEGLCWVLLYYYQGCASWKWFFPFHYAPFASDFFDISDLPNEFPTNTQPKRPLEQLMCVFPEASGQFLPTTWRKLMGDPESPIIDFYPEDFKIDLNGKKYAWQGVALLPFVDEDRMMSSLTRVYDDLTPQEEKRNSRGNDYLFVGVHHPLHALLKGLYEGGTPPMSYDEAADIDPGLAHGMAGKVWNDEHCKVGQTVVHAPVPIHNCLDSVMNNQVLSMAFKDPAYPEGHIFEAKLLPGAKFPPPSVKPQDLRSNDRGGGYRGNRGGNHWQPVIGFNHHRSRSALDPSSHRHIRHNMPYRGSSSYNNQGYNPRHRHEGPGGYRQNQNYQQNRSNDYNRGPA